MANSKMHIKALFLWFSIVSCILIIAGVIFSFFGFGIFPSSILPRHALLTWESSIYGSVLIGWGSTLFFLGRLAFRRNDVDLIKIMLLGIDIWLIIEALFSIYLGVFFNVGVDFAVLLLFNIPLFKSLQYLKQEFKKTNSKTIDK
jgi:hypothetical protein